MGFLRIAQCWYLIDVGKVFLAKGYLENGREKRSQSPACYNLSLIVDYSLFTKWRQSLSTLLYGRNRIIYSKKEKKYTLKEYGSEEMGCEKGNIGKEKGCEAGARTTISVTLA